MENHRKGREKSRYFTVSTAIRLIGTVLLLYPVYLETGKATVGLLILLAIGTELQVYNFFQISQTTKDTLELLRGRL